MPEAHDSPDFAGCRVRELPGPRCHTGESPLWDSDAGALYWADIPAGRLFRHRPGDVAAEAIFECPEPIAGLTLQRGGGLLLFRRKDVISLDLNTGQTKTVASGFAHAGVERFNDALALPDGSALAGTAGPGETANGLWRLAPDGTLAPLVRTTRMSNGLALSPDAATLYWTDTTRRRIEAFAVTYGPFALGPGRTLVAPPASDGGFLDGLTVDAAGRLWSARGDASAVVCHAPGGAELGRVRLPARRPLSCCFGGPGLQTLYVTTGDFGNGGPADGLTYAVEGFGVTGLQEHRAAMMRDV